MKKILLLIVAAMMAVGMEVRAEDEGVIKTWIDGVRYALYESPYTGEKMAYVIHTGDDKTEQSSYTGDIVIPETVTYEGVDYTMRYVEDNSFMKSTITSIDLPSTVTTIYEKAFLDCMNLQRMVVRATTPPKSRIWSQPYDFDQVFGSLDPDQLHVFVPVGCIETYQQSNQYWNAVMHYHEIGDPEGVENVQVSGKAHKKIVNGVLLIEQDGKLLNVLGVQVK